MARVFSLGLIQKRLTVRVVGIFAVIVIHRMICRPHNQVACHGKLSRYVKGGRVLLLPPYAYSIAH